MDAHLSGTPRSVAAGVIAGDEGGVASVRRARTLLRLDGTFEIALGLLLATSPLTGFHAARNLPAPATTPLVVGFGVLLVPVGIALWGASRGRGPGRSAIQGLALVNGAGAAIFALWVLLARASFPRDAATMVLLTAVVLAILAVLQARLARIAR